MFSCFPAIRWAAIRFDISAGLWFAFLRQRYPN
jgi:hypothetical protein